MTQEAGNGIEQAVTAQARFVKVTGGGGTGKSLCVARRVARLLAQGVSAAEIVVFASTPSAVRALQAALVRESGAAVHVQVTTLPAFCQRVLDTPEAREVTGRAPRLLADFEERILMEDMKVCGVKSKRLREMLKFFYREWTELGDEKPDFIRDTQEAEVYATLTENLRFRNAMMRQELSNVAVKFVRDHPQAAAPAFTPHVLVDDYMNLNRVSQMLLDLVATACLFVCGNINQTTHTTEPYPYPQGFACFEENHPDTEVVRLTQDLRTPKRITAMANSLMVAGGLETDTLVELTCDAPSDVHFVKWTYPNDEFLGIARHIKHRLASTSHPVHARDIFVAVPNAMWGRALAKVLNANDIKTDLVLDFNVLKGDPRDDAKSQALQAYTRLNLAANPDDPTAWRSWCGFGDYLTNSNHWFRLEKWAQERDIGILEALELLDALEDKPFEHSEVLLERYHAGREFIARTQGKKGFTLINQCSPVRGEVPPAAFMELLEPVEGTETGSELLARAMARLENRFNEDDAVRIGLMQMCCGMEFDTTVIMGAVEGFYPAADLLGPKFDDEQVALRKNQERRDWYNVMTKTRHALIVSTIQKDESNTAAALGMHAHRIRMEDGASRAILAPSCYMAEMGEDAPGIETSLA